MTTQIPQVSPFGHYSKIQAANALGLNRRTIYRYCSEGKLKLHYNKIIGTCYIMGADILKLWEGK